MNGRMQPKGFTDHGVEHGQILHFFVLHSTELALLSSSKILNLLIINGFSGSDKSYKKDAGDEGNFNSHYVWSVGQMQKSPSTCC
jgi:hypothetical protein